jgi:hypothetical protein
MGAAGELLRITTDQYKKMRRLHVLRLQELGCIDRNQFDRVGRASVTQQINFHITHKVRHSPKVVKAIATLLNAYDGDSSGLELMKRILIAIDELNLKQLEDLDFPK